MRKIMYSEVHRTVHKMCCVFGRLYFHSSSSTSSHSLLLRLYLLSMILTIAFLVKQEQLLIEPAARQVLDAVDFVVYLLFELPA